MAGVSCKAGTEAIVGLSNPSYNREGLRILFPGAAASGPSPSNPAFPSPGSLLWGVTFCSILTVGKRRCTQPRKVRVASVPPTARSSITREVGGGRVPLPSRRQPSHRAGTKAVSSAASWKAPGSLARSAGDGQRENGGGLSRGRRARGERTLHTLGRPPIPDTVVNIACCWSARIPSSCWDRPVRTRSRFDLDGGG